MRRKKLRAVIFGPQGAGKSPQIVMLASYFAVPLVASGEAFRAEIKENTSLGDLASEYVEAGMFAPDEMTNAIIARRLKEMDIEKGFVLDGYPRNVDQAETLDRIAKVNLAIQLKISDKTAMKRLAGRMMCAKCRMIYKHDDVEERADCAACGGALVNRKKDEEEVVRRRLAAYHFMTEPLSGYYRQRGVLLAINGEQKEEDLSKELVKKLAKLGFVA